MLDTSSTQNRNRTNYHSHCSFCDGKAPMEDFVREAIKQGFTAYGISSHSPLPFHAPWVLAKEDIPAYLAEISRLKEKYGTEIELYAGMEIDYLEEAYNPAISFFQELPLDFRIGSVHFVPDANGELKDIDQSEPMFRDLVYAFFAGDLRRLISAYFDASMRMVEKGGFDFIGHADKVHYNAEGIEPGITATHWYQNKLKEYFSYVMEKGMMVEINTKVYERKGCFYPSAAHFTILRDLNVPVLVNSDTHLPEKVNSGREEAFLLLKTAGYRTVRQLKQGKWQDVEI